MSVWAVVLACGKDQEIGDGIDVSFLALGSRPVLARSVQVLDKNPSVDGIVLVVRKERVDNALQVVRSYGCRKIAAIVAGGAGRLANLKSAFERIPADASAVLVHDAARPFVTDEVITEAVKAGKRYGAAIAAIRSSDSVKLAEKGQKVSAHPDRNTVWLVQTPQVYKIEIFKKILKASGKLSDDESVLLEKMKQPIHLVAGTVANMKIRNAHDLQIAAAMLSVARQTP